MKKTLIIIFSLVLALLFSSCDGVVLYPELLMQPPVFSAEQKQIYNALNESIGKDFLLQYPTQGDNRSAIILNDLDEDGKNEALVLYKANEEADTRINVLSQTNDGWRTVCDVAGYSGDVREIEFCKISDTKQKSVLIGFDQSTVSTNIMLVYNYQNGRLLPLYIRDYSALNVGDINNDSTDELIVINNNFSSRKAYASVLSIKNNEIVTELEVPMNEDVLEYKGIRFGSISDSNPALYIDSKLSSGSLITEVLVYNNGALTNFSYGYDSVLIEETMRQNEILCEDIDNDGTIEIPTTVAFKESILTETAVPLTAWKSFNGFNLETVKISADNLNYGYRVFMPENWLENRVIVNDIISNNEWRFMGIGEDNMQFSQTLLSIRVYSSGEIIDNTSLKGYTKFYESVTHSYYAYIPENVSEEYKITLEQLKQNFSLIK